MNNKTLSKVILIGIKQDGSKEIVTTNVNKYNYNDVVRDIEFIKSLEDTSMILGDDAPSIHLPFEEEGLACSKMIVEEIYL